MPEPADAANADTRRVGASNRWPDVLRHTWWSALDDSARRQGDDRSAFEFEGAGWSRTLSFGAWRESSDAVARALARLGVGTGDRVATLGLGGPAWPILEVACSRVGAILVPINYRYRHDELTHVMRLAQPIVTLSAECVHRTATLVGLRRAVRDAGIRTHFVALDGPDVALADEIDAAAAAEPSDVGSWPEFLALGWASAPPLPVTDPDAAVLLQFTSGTTAFPKGALLSNAATLGTSLQLAWRMGLSADDRFYSTQPFYHVGGSVATTLMPLTVGCIAIAPERYTVEGTFRIVTKHRCTARTGQAAMYWMEMAHEGFSPEIFASTDRGWAGGTPELRRMIIERMGIEHLTTVYGMTEAAATTTVPQHDAPAEVRIETCGPPLPEVDVTIAVASGEKVTTPGVEGEICIRGWPLMLGYFGDQEATAATIDADGWLHSGDLGRLDTDGNLTIVDRLKDMIKPGGENVSPAEVERVIEGIEDVVQVAVVGMPDVRLGEVPVAFVQLRPGARADERSIIDVCAEEMASFKVPRRIISVDDWPLTESGKIQKHVLRSRVADGATSLIGRTG
jgi:fatty-acyl-CoA synthase/long-chain acyl-CoA synthetase